MSLYTLVGGMLRNTVSRIWPRIDTTPLETKEEIRRRRSMLYHMLHQIKAENGIYFEDMDRVYRAELENDP